MLIELYIKNLAVIHELRLDFGKGFQILTGETGAGKSILVQAIALIQGQKAQASWIRDGEEESLVEAVYDISAVKGLKDDLASQDLNHPDDDNQLVVKRVIRRDGQNRVYINHQRSSLTVLQNLANHVLDFTGQREQMQLLDSSQDIFLVDAFLKLPKLKDQYGELYRQLSSLQKKLKELKDNMSQKVERLSWLKFQFKEFEALDIYTDDEYQELLTQQEQLKNSEHISTLVAKASQVLNEDENSCSQQLLELKQMWSASSYMSAHNPKVLERLESLLIDTEDLAFEVSKLLPRTQSCSLDEVQGRLHTLEKLKRKHGPDLCDVLQKKSELADEIHQLENADSSLEALQQELKQVFDHLRKVAAELTKERLVIKKQLEKQITAELKFLQMPHVKFCVDIQDRGARDDAASYGPQGCDQVKFLLSPNPGMALRPLAKIASGGETSRIFLALKNVFAKKRLAGTLIFDEIDTGISGATVELVGRKLKELSQKFQVFCITHHAQIASLADQHFQVQKAVEKNQTITRVMCLKEHERVQEVARLMGGVKISDQNLKFAKEMIEGSKT